MKIPVFMPKDSKSLSKSQIIVLVAVTIFVFIEIALFMMGYLSFNKDAMDRPNQDSDEEVSTSTDVDAVPEMSSEVDEEATSTQARVEVEIEDETGEGTGSKVGIFDVSASNSGFNPSSLVVTQGDIVQIEYFSEDGIDFYIPAYGVHLADAQGQRQVSFNASAVGTFRIECRDSCPSGGKIYGELLVKTKQ